MIQILWVAVCILLIISILEIFYPKVLHEGLLNLGDSAWWSQYVPRRGDVGLEEESEEGGYKRDRRYFAGYTDVQRLGVNQDFCRMVTTTGSRPETFFACALGGTEGLSSVRYRTRTPLELSRDDYMGSKNQGYCRILKTDLYTFEARCNPEQDEGFGAKLLVDVSPPDDIEELLLFYRGCVFWLRFVDDMVDYAKNLTIMTAGFLHVEEEPPLRLSEHPIARTLEFNGTDQFMRIGDGKDLEFGRSIDLRYLRAVSLWVYFEEFTNNAQIFDFGDGAGDNNVRLGILGRGSTGTSQPPMDPSCGVNGNESTVPKAPSGAQPAQMVTPQVLMETTPANVDEYTCPKPDIFGRTLPPVQPKAECPHAAHVADLAYEIWDHRQRKVHVQLSKAMPLRKWTHVVITTTNQDAARPNLRFYINGKLVHEEKSAWLPQESGTTHNYLGKSNWMDDTSMYENGDELFKGKMFDVRGYQTSMNEDKIKKTVAWGKGLLGGDTTPAGGLSPPSEKLGDTTS